MTYSLYDTKSTAAIAAPGTTNKIILFTRAVILAAGFTVTSLALSSESTPVIGDSQHHPSGHFSNQSLEGWSERSFKGNTEYKLVDDGGVTVLRGHAKAQASILYREQTINLQKSPIISWSWKVDRAFDDIDERSKSGDDFPARLYVVAKVGFLPWETLAINYVWASDSGPGESWDNPFTDKAKMVVVQSGPDNVGKWMLETRDVEADFREQFGTDIDEIDGYAVMVDGDNSNREATAWFGEIQFSPR